MFNNTPIFHIGYPHAGSTALQTEIFSKLSDVDYVGRYEIIDKDSVISNITERSVSFPYQEDSNIVKFYRAISTADSLNYDFVNNRNLLNAFAANCKKSHALLSWEGITGLGSGSPDLTVKAQRIRELFVDIKLIIIIREQKAITQAYYLSQQPGEADSGGTGAMPFNEWFTMTNQADKFSFGDTLHYHQVTELYRSIFGKKTVLVLPYEMMLQHPAEFGNRLGEFTGLNPNEIDKTLRLAAEKGGFNEPGSDDNSKGPVSLKAKLSKWFSGATKSLIPAEIADGMDQEYAGGNAEVCKEWDLDLKSYGYPVG